jgi:hypothetical protein
MQGGSDVNDSFGIFSGLATTRRRSVKRSSPLAAGNNTSMLLIVETAATRFLEQVPRPLLDLCEVAKDEALYNRPLASTRGAEMSLSVPVRWIF